MLFLMISVDTETILHSIPYLLGQKLATISFVLNQCGNCFEFIHHENNLQILIFTIGCGCHIRQKAIFYARVHHCNEVLDL